MPWTLRSKSKGALREDAQQAAAPHGRAASRPQKAANHPALRALDTSTVPPPPRIPQDSETFFEDATPGGANGRPDDGHKDFARFKGPRDSHDLSLADDTRGSLVETMLFSLDQMPAAAGGPSGHPRRVAPYDDDDDAEFYAATSRLATPRSHAGHAHSSSYSSDYDVRHDDSIHRYPNAPFTRSRRSNSSSNFHPGLGRFDNGRTAGRFASEPERRGREANSSAHVRGGGKGKKGSGSSSVDHGHGSDITASTRRAKRSASFDQSYSDRLIPRDSSLQPLSAPVADGARPPPPPLDPYAYDAAPTPTVPAGPRRLPEPVSAPTAYPPPPPYPPAGLPSPQRRSSMRSGTSRSARKGRLDTPDASVRSRATDFVQATAAANDGRDLAPAPAFVDDPPAPSPTVALRKGSSQHPAGQTPPARDRPGFFRRVFGSSKPSSPAHPPHPGRQYSAPATASSYVPSQMDGGAPPLVANQNHVACQMKAVSAAAPAVSSTEPQRPPTQPTLTKKHSSFFRRRKKSVSEAAPTPPPPVPPLQLQPQKQQPQQQQPGPPMSPSISSLRKVMTPYLNDPGYSPGKMFPDAREKQPRPTTTGEHDAGKPVGFSPGYSPQPGSTVRAIRGASHENDVAMPPSPTPAGEPRRAVQGHAHDTPRLKLKVKRNRGTGQPHAFDDTFLADSSGNEDRSPGLGPDKSSPAHGSYDDLRRPMTSPTTSFRESPGVSQENELLTPTPSRPKAQSPVSPAFGLKGTPGAFPDVTDGDLVVTTPSKEERKASVHSASSTRVWLEPTSSEEKLTLPLEGARTAEPDKASPATTVSNEAFQSATSLPLADAADEAPTPDEAPSPLAPVPKEPTRPAPVPDATPTTDDYVRADKIFHGDEDVVAKDRACAWLGDASHRGAMARKAYMELFDWAGMNLLAAMRDLCGRLVLKGETQQVDRVLDALSCRWCECNPRHGFKSTDVVHTICYSILLLNTDLHLADIGEKMTRSQFVKNTLPTIRRVVFDSAPELADETIRPAGSHARPTVPWTEPTTPRSSSPIVTPFEGEERHSLDTKRSRNRLSLRPASRTADSSESAATVDAAGAGAGDSCNVLVKAPYDGHMRGWEFQVEIVLKDFYSSIRAQRLPLHGADPHLREDRHHHGRPPMPDGHPSSSNSLSVSAVLRRTPSVLSKAASESAGSSLRGRVGPGGSAGGAPPPGGAHDFRSVAARWHPKTRASRPRLYPSSTVGSSRTSLDDGASSVWSPAGSSTWSKYSLGKTQTSLSMDSLGSHAASLPGGPGGPGGPGDFQQSIGFANALSQAIIREEGGNGSPGETDGGRVAPLPLLEDESLGLAGPPWAKEGLLKHKHHLESVDKKAKDRTWSECFAVIEKGWIRLFSFPNSAHGGGGTASSLRINKSSSHHKPRPSGGSGGGGAEGLVVGGGNWTESAAARGAFLLRQTIASSLPPPGYSKARPHVWALSLPTGAVHLFQAGTPDVAREFVQTANYWSARLSKEPLVAAVSNVEYGWSDAVVNAALISALPAPPASAGSASGGPPATSSSAGSGNVPAPPPPLTRPRGASSASLSSLPRPSLQGSLRTASTDHPRGLSVSSTTPRSHRNNSLPAPPGDRATIADWTPPTQSLLASSLMEVDQLRALTAYVTNVERELAEHNELRVAMAVAFSPRHQNAGRAMGNWEKKSAYLLREIVKFRTYIDSLAAAGVARERVYKERREREGVKSQEGSKEAEARQEIVV